VFDAKMMIGRIKKSIGEEQKEALALAKLTFC